MSQENYYTVGELAHSVGVTVRTIQYYDQKGLLSPSAKGPQNQRLYTEDDRQHLHRILTLKYLGLSLSDIRDEATHYQNNEEFHMLAHRKMDEIEQSFQALFKRMTTLRALQDKTVKCNNESIDWQELTQTIEEHQDESQFFWRLTGIRDDELNEFQAGAELKREELFSKWHELIADVIKLMAENEPVDGPRNRALAERYLELGDSQQMFSAEQNFILLGNTALHDSTANTHASIDVGNQEGQQHNKSSGDFDSHHAHMHGHGSFDTLRESVVAYLEKVVAAYAASQE